MMRLILKICLVGILLCILQSFAASELRVRTKHRLALEGLTLGMSFEEARTSQEPLGRRPHVFNPQDERQVSFVEVPSPLWPQSGGRARFCPEGKIVQICGLYLEVDGIGIPVQSSISDFVSILGEPTIFVHEFHIPTKSDVRLMEEILSPGASNEELRELFLDTVKDLGVIAMYKDLGLKIRFSGARSKLSWIEWGRQPLSDLWSENQSCNLQRQPGPTCQQ